MNDGRTFNDCVFIQDVLGGAIVSSPVVDRGTIYFGSADGNVYARHEHKMILEFDDEDHITERWTWRKNGKDTEMIYHLVRKK